MLSFLLVRDLPRNIEYLPVGQALQRQPGAKTDVEPTLLEFISVQEIIISQLIISVRVL